MVLLPPTTDQPEILSSPSQAESKASSEVTILFSGNLSWFLSFVFFSIQYEWTKSLQDAKYSETHNSYGNRYSLAYSTHGLPWRFSKFPWTLHLRQEPRTSGLLYCPKHLALCTAQSRSQHPNPRPGPRGQGLAAGRSTAPGVRSHPDGAELANALPEPRPPLSARRLPSQASAALELPGRGQGFLADPPRSTRQVPQPPTLPAAAARLGARGRTGAPQGVSRAGARATHRRQTPQLGRRCGRRSATATSTGLRRDSSRARHFLPREADRKAHRKTRREPSRDEGSRPGLSLRLEQTGCGRRGAGPPSAARGLAVFLRLSDLARRPPLRGSRGPAARPPPPSAANSRGPSAFPGRRARGWAWNSTRAGRGAAWSLKVSGCPGAGSRPPVAASYPVTSENTARLVKFELQAKQVIFWGTSHIILGKVGGGRADSWMLENLFFCKLHSSRIVFTPAPPFLP